MKVPEASLDSTEGVPALKLTTAHCSTALVAAAAHSLLHVRWIG